MCALDSLLDLSMLAASSLACQQGLLVAVKITPAIVQATYARFCVVSPFRGWHLPTPEDMKFIVTKHPTKRGDYAHRNGRHELRVSAAVHDTLHALDMTVAHEMCHVKEMIDGVWRNDVAHSAYFCRLADRVCKVLLYDRGQF